MGELNIIGVVGAGNMGSGIAQKLAQEGLQVILADMAPEFVERGRATIRKILEGGIKRGLFTSSQINDILNRIHGTTDLNRLADADVVIEVVFEDAQVKRELFAKLDAICPEHTIFATNTSSFYVADLAAATSRPDRFIGMHYFYHPAKNRLLEIIPHAGTCDATIEQALMLSRLHAKTAIVVKDAPGFAVNRFFVPLLTESVKIVEDGLAGIADVEAAAKNAFHIGMGPFELMNVTGIPIAVHSSATFGRELGSFYDTPRLLKQQMDKNEPWDLSGEPDDAKFEIIQDRLYGACLGAAAALASENVASIEDIDRGAKIGLRWRLGPFELMNKIGIDRTYRVIQAVADRYSDFNMPDIIIHQKKRATPFTFQYVDQHTKDGIAFLTINRPEAMNALNKVTVDQLDEAFTAAEKNPHVNAIVFQGAGKAFVAGADIKFFVDNINEDHIDDTVAFTRKGHDLLLRIEESKKLTVAILDGMSLGGGSELALACQGIIATPAGSLGFPETGIGIYPGLGGMLRLARQIGSELAKYYVLTGTTITAQDAFELGIFTRLVSPSELTRSILDLCKQGKPDKYHPRTLPAKYIEAAKTCTPQNIQLLLSGIKPDGISEELAEKTAKKLSAKAPLALQKVIELMDKQQSMTIPNAIGLELANLEDIFSTHDALEGLRSVGRRPPQYLGK